MGRFLRSTPYPVGNFLSIAFIVSIVSSASNQSPPKRSNSNSSGAGVSASYEVSSGCKKISEF